MAENGVTIRAWAQEAGFSEGLVYAVLNGKNKATRGESFRIAVALGLKRKPEINEIPLYLLSMISGGSRESFLDKDTSYKHKENRMS
jgi:gp16 family phage-associated protein